MLRNLKRWACNRISTECDGSPTESHGGENGSAIGSLRDAIAVQHNPIGMISEGYRTLRDGIGVIWNPIGGAWARY
eukprot:9374464-Pyramimonas_sp.AAC.1